MLGVADTSFRKKMVVSCSFIINLGILAVFKYSNFVLNSISSLCSLFGASFTERRIDVLLPVGISFYTFQALSYTVDVYRGKIDAEKNFLKYALFVSFFPQLVAGPIERSGNLLNQIRDISHEKLMRPERIRDGLVLMLWGFFQKLVIADRASILVDHVYGNYHEFGFFGLGIATVFFTIQIYCDFGGYSNIARGAAAVLGIDLMQNFRQPYLATDIRDFWSRWHISLTSWFTDYLYIPLGGNRKGRIRKYLNIMIVFLVSGLWHGASWNYVVWGGIHGIYRIVGECTDSIKCSIKGLDRTVIKIFKMTGTFCLVSFAWVFFAADNLGHALGIITRMFTVFSFGDIHDLKLSKANEIVFIVSVAILTIVDLLRDKGESPISILNRKPVPVRWLLYITMIWITIMLGIYGIEYDATQFIYFQF